MEFCRLIGGGLLIPLRKRETQEAGFGSIVGRINFQEGGCAVFPRTALLFRVYWKVNQETPCILPKKKNIHHNITKNA